MLLILNNCFHQKVLVLNIHVPLFVNIRKLVYLYIWGTFSNIQDDDFYQHSRMN